MFNRTTSAKFIAPRRQERKEKYLLFVRPWRTLRLRASDLFPNPYSKIQSKISNVFGYIHGGEWMK
jgi:hypothetical protein